MLPCGQVCVNAATPMPIGTECHACRAVADREALKQWRKVAKGKATVESAGLRQEMVEYLRAAVSASPGARAMAAPSAGGDEGSA